MAAKTASFTTPGMRAPVVAEMESEALQQALLAKALAEQQGGLSGAPANTGRFLALNLDPLANALQSRVAQAKLEASRKRSLDLEGRFAEEQARELRRFRTAEEGEVVAGPPEANGTLPRTAGNPRAFRDFETSPYPAVAAQAAERGKLYAEQLKALLPRASFDSVQQSGDRIEGLRPKETQQVIGDLPVTWGEGRQPTPVAGTYRSGPPLPSGAPTQLNSFTRKVEAVDKAPRQEVNLGEKADVKVLGDQGTNAVKRGEKLLLNLDRTIRSLASAEQAAEAGAIQGTAEPILAAAAGVLAQLGLAPEEIRRKLVNNEQIHFSMAQSIRNVLADAGYNPSNMDLVFAQKGAGSALNTPQGLLKAIYAARADILNELASHNENVDKLLPRLPSLEMARVRSPAARDTREPPPPNTPREVQEEYAGALYIPGYTFDRNRQRYRPRTVEDILLERKGAK